MINDSDVRIVQGDALERLREMADGSVHCIVTSPPFWALRDYGTGTWEGGDPACDHVKPTRHQAQGATSQRKGRANAEAQRNETFLGECERCGAVRVDRQIGAEPTPDEWVASLVAVFRECRRVLRDDGVFWLEVGDTYAGGGGYSPGSPSNVARQEARANGSVISDGFYVSDETNHLARRKVPDRLEGVKPKDLVGAPWMLAFALRADGWYLRSDTIWARPNPMPESVTDRPTKTHSYVFLLTKKPRYFYDADAIRTPHKMDGRKVTTVVAGEGSEQHRDGERWPGSGANAKSVWDLEKGDVVAVCGVAMTVWKTDPLTLEPAPVAESVWRIPTESTPFAHFATMPQALAERCIKAGTSEHGCCSECGSPWTRETEIVRSLESGSGRSGNAPLGKNGSGLQGAGATRDVRNGPTVHVTTTGWTRTCTHDAPVKPCTVLDPFMGSGTTALVARRLGRHAVGIELNPEYVEIAARRLQQLSLLG